MLIFYSILKALSSDKINKLVKSRNYFKNWVKNSYTYKRFYQLSFFMFLPIVFGSFFQTKVLEFGSFSLVINLLVFLVAIFYIFAFPIIQFIVIVKNKKNLEEKETISAYGELYEGYNYKKSGFTKYFNFIYYLRKLIFGIFIVFLHDSTEIQLVIFMALSLLVLFLSLVFRVGLDKWEQMKINFTEILLVFTEIFIFLLNNDPVG